MADFMVDDLQATLQQLRQTQGNPAVSVFVPTHRTFPDNEQDHIALKNQLKVVEERVGEEYDKRTAQAMLDAIDAQIADIDHNYNLDTLAIFATPDSAQVLRLPFDTPERVIVGDKFAIRDLMRNLSQSLNYYVLAVTNDSARLIEGVDDRLVKEIKEGSARQKNMKNIPFPIHNTTLPTNSKADRTGSSDDDKYLKEFFNRVDKSMQEIHGVAPKPVFVMADSQNIGVYEQVCDNPSIIAGKIDNIDHMDDANPQAFIDAVQSLVEQQREARYTTAEGELEKARNENMLRTDLQEVYRAAFEGNAQTLLVKTGYRVPARIDETAQTLQVVDESDENSPNVIDDAVGEIIDLAKQNGANVVFMPADRMDDKEPVVLITRY